MKKIRFIHIVLLMILLACQPTPEKEIIVSHDLKQANAAVPGEPGAALVVPERWEETMEIPVSSGVGSATVIFDADIRISPDDVHPILRVCRDSFSGEKCKEIFEAAYGPGEWRENELCREDIIVIINQIRLGEVDGYDYTTQQFISTPFEDETERLEPYIQQLQDAPAEDTFVPLTAEHLDAANISHRAIRTGNGDLIYVNKSNLEGFTYFSINKWSFGFIQPESWVLQGDALIDEPPHALEHVKITESEAIETADAFLQKLKRDDLKFSYAEKARLFKEWGTRADDAISEGYLLHYAQAANGCVANGYDLRYGQRFLEFEGSETIYSLEWCQEIVDIFVTENGIELINWSNPLEIQGVEQGDAALLPFDQVQERIKTLLGYGIKGSSYMDKHTGNIYIEEIMLSSVLRPVRDDPEHALLTPAWIVRFSTDSFRKQYIDSCFLVIDATDGSLIR